MIVLPGPASPQLGYRVAIEMGVRAVPVDHRVFPDSENYIRIMGDVRGEHAAIIQTTAPNPNRSLIQLLITAGTVKDFGASKITAVVPYLAYSRQDHRFLEGEALSLDIVFRLLESVGVSELVVVDVHNEASIRSVEANHGIKVINVSAIPLLARRLRDEGYGGAISLSPDKGAIGHAEAAAEVLGGGSNFFEKTRDRKTGDVQMKAKNLHLRTGLAAVFDDIISSGGTMAQAVAALKQQGAVRVAVACTHALFMSGAEERIMKAGADLIISADTVDTPFGKVTVAGLIAETLKKLE